MTTDSTITSRRAILAGALIAAPAVAALATSTRGFPLAVNTAAWDQTLAAFRKVEMTHDALWDSWERADEAVGDNTPDRVDRYFDDYRLGIGMKRDAVEYWLNAYNVGRGEGRIDVARTADEFDAYQRQTLDARERFQTDRRYKEASGHNPVYQAARDALMEVPAPTIAALLIKIEIAAVSLDDDHGQSTLSDARRLLSGEA